MVNTDQFKLASLYSRTHDIMRNIDGLQPQEAFDELLKFLFFKQANEESGPELAYPTDFSLNGLFAPLNKNLAEQIKALFAQYVKTFNSWFQDLWKDARFHLSDTALLSICEVFKEINFSSVPYDVRSAALREFLSPEIRRGLGIYLTPDDVVRMMVEFVVPGPEDAVYDPACGSGTFLIETLKFMSQQPSSKKVAIWGTDKNPRMLLLSELNLGHFAGTTFHRQLVDSLYPDFNCPENWLGPENFDVIFTNPPFGVALYNASYDLRGFETCKSKKGGLVNRQQSEVIFIEQAIKYLKPGGILAIVLPKSVLTNSNLETARKALDQLGYIYAAVSLPPETFAATGTQTSTIVLFIKKFISKAEASDRITIAFADVTNVGFDATGRFRAENQLIKLPEDLKKSLAENKNRGVCRMLPTVSKHATFSYLKNLMTAENSIQSKFKLRDIVEFATTGKTPPRKNYTPDGLFVVKVGNLTGNGINWQPRDRNFIDCSEIPKRAKQNLIVKEGDILLTSSAHSVIYIAKKVDIVHKIPKWVGGNASIVGEVMLLRPNKEKIDPYALLAYLRLPSVVAQIQRLVRGQTAHLYADDLLDIPIPDTLMKRCTTSTEVQGKKALDKIINALRLETELNQRLNECAFEQEVLFQSIDLSA